MKKKKMIFYMLLIGIGFGVYEYLLVTKGEVEFDLVKHLISPLVIFLLLTLMAEKLWRETTDGFLEVMKSGSTRATERQYVMISWVFSTAQVYVDFKDTLYYEGHKVELIILTLLLVVTFALSCKIASALAQLLRYQRREIGKE